MPVREILQHPNPLLSKVCKGLDWDSPLAVDVVKDLVDTLAATENCVGLSANQIGYDARAIICVQIDPASQHPFVMCIINPEVTRLEQRKEDEIEGCKSLPDDDFYIVRRHYKVALRGRTPDGKKIDLRLTGWNARVVQHEFDHLQGREITMIGRRIEQAPA